MRKKTIDQHTVPKLWLKHFTYNKKKSSVYVYSKIDEKSIGSKSTSTLTTQEYFYDFHRIIQDDLINQGIFETGDLDDEQYVEKKFFSYNIEDKLGPLLQDTINNIKK